MSMTIEEWELTLPERERKNFEKELLSGRILEHCDGCRHHKYLKAAVESLASQGMEVIITQAPGFLRYELAHAKLARALRGYVRYGEKS